MGMNMPMDADEVMHRLAVEAIETESGREISAELFWAYEHADEWELTKMRELISVQEKAAEATFAFLRDMRVRRT